MNSAAHLSTEQVADLLGGNLPATEAMAANAHVASCPTCAEVRSAIEDVSALLTEVGDVSVAMPADVAERLDAAIRAASTERAAGVRNLEPTASPRVSRPLRWLMGAAAAVVVVSLGVVGLRALPVTSSDTAGSASQTASDRGIDDQAGRGGLASGGKQPSVPTSTGAETQKSDGLTLTLPSLRRDSVSATAASLAASPNRAVPPTQAGCAAPFVDFSVTSAVRFNDERAVLAIMRATHTATVFDCRTATRALFTVGY